MDASVTLLILAVASIVVWTIVVGSKWPKPYGERICQGPDWRREFPNVAKAEIREFLAIVANSFAVDDKQSLKVHPNDSILAIYKATYPHPWMADVLEIETLADELQSKYGYALTKHWSESLTLGEVFEHIQRNGLAANDA